MDEFTNKHKQTIDIIKNSNISDSSKEKYMLQVHDLQNINNSTDILSVKSAISKLDNIASLAAYDANSVTILEDSGSPPDYNRIKMENLNLQDNNANLQRQQINDLNAIIQRNNQINQLNNDNKRLELAINDLQRSLNEAKNHIQVLENNDNIQQLKIQLSNYDTKIRGLTEKNHVLNQKITQLNDTINMHKQEINTYKNNESKLTDSLKEIDQQLKNCKQENNNLLQQIEILKNDIYKLTVELNNCNHNLEQCNQKNNDMISELKTKDAKITRLDGELKNCSDQNRQLIQTLEQKDAEINRLDGELKNCSDQNRQLIQTLEQKDAEINRLDGELKNCSDQNRQLIQTLEQKDAEINRLTEEIAQKDEQIKRLTDELTNKRPSEDYELYKNEVYKLRNEYSQLLIGLRNELDIGDDINESQRKPYTDNEYTQMSPEPSNANYLMNKLINEKNIREDKENKGNIDIKSYLYEIRNGDAIKFKSLFYTLRGALGAYYTSIDAHRTQLVGIRTLLNKINNYILDKSIIQSFSYNSIARTPNINDRTFSLIYNIANIMKLGDATNHLNRIDRIGGNNAFSSGTNGLLILFDTNDMVGGVSKVKYDFTKNLTPSPINTVTITDAINLMQILIYGITCKKGKTSGVGGPNDPNTYINNFFTWDTTGKSLLIDTKMMDPTKVSGGNVSKLVPNNIGGRLSNYISTGQLYFAVICICIVIIAILIIRKFAKTHIVKPNKYSMQLSYVNNIYNENWHT